VRNAKILFYFFKYGESRVLNEEIAKLFLEEISTIRRTPHVSDWLIKWHKQKKKFFDRGMSVREKDHNPFQEPKGSGNNLLSKKDNSQFANVHNPTPIQYMRKI